MKNLKIAITGGIGSGKSEVSKIIESKGYIVLSADSIAKNIMSKSEIKKQIADNFNLTIDLNGNYEKKELAQIVFNDKSALKWLNNFIHPLVIKEIFDNLKKTKGLAFAEIPLLFESGTEKMFDKVIIVKRKLESRIESVMNRDNLSRREILNRIKNQYNYENLQNIEHTVIYNDFDLETLNKQVEKVLNEMEKNQII
jgi:dephospho-CoA kinase